MHITTFRDNAWECIKLAIVPQEVIECNIKWKSDLMYAYSTAIEILNLKDEGEREKTMKPWIILLKLVQRS